jgi:hypothetical protein
MPLMKTPRPHPAILGVLQMKSEIAALLTVVANDFAASTARDAAPSHPQSKFGRLDQTNTDAFGHERRVRWCPGLRVSIERAERWFLELRGRPPPLNGGRPNALRFPCSGSGANMGIARSRLSHNDERTFQNTPFHPDANLCRDSRRLCIHASGGSQQDRFDGIAAPAGNSVRA